MGRVRTNISLSICTREMLWTKRYSQNSQDIFVLRAWMGWEGWNVVYFGTCSYNVTTHNQFDINTYPQGNLPWSQTYPKLSMPIVAKDGWTILVVTFPRNRFVKNILRRNVDKNSTKIFSLTHSHSGNIWRRNVDLILTNNFPSNILWIN